MYKLLAQFKKSNIGYRLTKGLSWSIIGSIIGKGLMLISFMIVARMLGKEDYGKVGIIRSTINMFMTFSTIGMGLTASRYIAFYRDINKDKTYQIYKASNYIAIFFGAIISLIVLIFSAEISKISFGTATLSLPLKISVISLFFLTLNSSQNGALNGFEAFKQISINSVISGILQTILIVGGAFLYGLDGVIFGLGIGVLSLCLLHQKSLRNIFSHLGQVSVKKIFDSEIKSIFIRFSLPAALGGLVSVPVLWWTKSYLVRNVGFGEMAIFDVAEQWNVMLLFIPNSISGIILPLLTNTLAVGTQKQYNKLIKLNLVINGGISLILSLLIIPFAPYILQLYGNSFTNFSPLRIMLVVAVLQAINGVLGQVIASKGRMWLGLLVNLLWGIWLILFTLLFISYFHLGALGLSYAMLISYFLHSVAQGIIALKFKI